RRCACATCRRRRPSARCARSLPPTSAAAAARPRRIRPAGWPPSPRRPRRCGSSSSGCRRTRGRGRLWAAASAQRPARRPRSAARRPRARPRRTASGPRGHTAARSSWALLILACRRCTRCRSDRTCRAQLRRRGPSTRRRRRARRPSPCRTASTSSRRAGRRTSDEDKIGGADTTDFARRKCVTFDTRMFLR
ncbi:unnamed protein product, partial [Prorocentrum cordatum]